MRRYLPVLFPVAAIAAWTYLHEPLRGAGLGLLEGPALLLGVMSPGLLVSFEALPQVLLPSGVRIWWRHQQDHRPAIPRRLRLAVLAADRHRCCYCGSVFQLQVDHIRPWSLGGLSALWNLAVLCGPCNRVKSNYWVARDGYVFYRGFQGSENQRLAAEIFRFERRHRWNPGRWMRAGWSLAS